MDDVAIQVENLHKSFDDVHAVHGVSFAVRRGEVFSLLGPNGAGKSTTNSRIAAFTPFTWMVDGFKDVIGRGLGLQAVLLVGDVRLLYAVLLWMLAAWRFRFE